MQEELTSFELRMRFSCVCIPLLRYTLGAFTAVTAVPIRLPFFHSGYDTV